MAIDYVVPMVFPEDRRWRKDYVAAYGGYGDDLTAIDNVRYRTWGTEQLAVRCVRKFMPWVRDVIILLARPSQVQGWMKTPQPPLGGAQIRLVFHDEFMPSDKLPTFNSTAIEMYLHRIPGLSEYFIYANDDMYVLSPLAESDFFRDGLPCLHTTKRAFITSSTYQMTCMNGLNLVAEESGKHFTHEWLHLGHTIVPMLKKTCEMFWEKWPEKMERSVTPFRKICNYNQYIYSWWHVLSGKYVDYAPEHPYISTGNTIEEVVATIRSTNGIICVNDASADKDIEPYAEAVRCEIERRLA